MNVSLGILGHDPRITISVVGGGGSDPIQAMHAARRRFASQGAERVTLIPRRGGEGWAIAKKKKKEDTND